MNYNFEIEGSIDLYFPKSAWPFESIPRKGDLINLTDIVSNTHQDYDLIINTWFKVRFVKWELGDVTIVLKSK